MAMSPYEEAMLEETKRHNAVVEDMFTGLLRILRTGSETLEDLNTIARAK